ncbi:hypothetical protein [Dongia sp.]|uniref:hypothetical protein n=1 Tax=Dongia sp. TaxID=1977262 RepID=UPI0035AEF253
MRRTRPSLIAFNRPVLRTLALAYALLLQSVLGTALASTHAFAMAEQQALGLVSLCADGAVSTPTKQAPGSPASDRDCFNCKTACIGIGGQIALPQPPAPIFMPVAPCSAPAPRAIATPHILPASRFPSDLANRAPPVRLT